MHPNSFIQI